MSNTPVTLAIVQNLAEDVARQLDLSRRIDHHGESGRAREQILTAFIRRLVPSSFGVSTGFVLDAVGGLSRQVDIVIYRTDYAPIFDIGNVKHFFVESVVAVMEVKAAITSTARLDQALQNIRSVKQLDRSNQGRNYTLLDRHGGPRVNLESFDHQVFGAIITERSLSRDILRERLLDFLRSNPRRVWPNTYVDVHGPAVAYTGQGTPVSSDPTGCTDLWFDSTFALFGVRRICGQPGSPGAGWLCGVAVRA